MPNKLLKNFLLICFLVVFIGSKGYCQNSLEGFNFQALVLNSSGKAVVNKNVNVKFNIYFDSLRTMLAYGEKYSITTNKFGLFTLTVGQGVNLHSGIDTSFNAINWSTGNYFLNVQIDTTGSLSYIDLGITKMISVPYALYSRSASNLRNGYSLNDLTDADTSGVYLNYLLKWNGNLWVPSKDLFNDTVNYAYSVSHVINTDTAAIVINSGPHTHADSAQYAVHSDSSSYSGNSLYANTTNHSIYSDTTSYAISASPAWSITGNATLSGGSFLGSGDNKNIVFETNNISHVFISSAGAVGINTSSPQSLLHIISNDPLLQQGTLGSTVSAPSGSGARMVWSPAKGAFRAGYVVGNNWDIDSLGNYSFAAGYNNRASGNNSAGGNYSLAFGSNNIVVAGGAMALGANNVITKVNITDYCSVAMGMNNVLTGVREVVIGDSNIVNGGSCSTIGSYNTTGGNINAVIGYRCIGIGGTCVSMGYYANDNRKHGSFVFSDASKPMYVHSLADNDFVVRASGGVIFYTDPDTTMGVYLAPGSGSWSSISNRNKKENFLPVDDEEVLQKISELKIKKWKYKTEKNAYHIGVIAQDFYKQFHLGESPQSITMTDIDGVILSCIKALFKRVDTVSEKYNDLGTLSSEEESLSADFKELDRRLHLIETSTK